MPPPTVTIDLSQSRGVSGGSERNSASFTDDSASSPVDVTLGSPLSPEAGYQSSPADDWEEEEDFVDVVAPSDSASVGPTIVRRRTVVESSQPLARQPSHPPPAPELNSHRTSSREHRESSGRREHRDHREPSDHRDRRRHRDRRDRRDHRDLPRRIPSDHSDSVGSHEEYVGYGPPPDHAHGQWGFLPQQRPAGYASSVASYTGYHSNGQLVHMQSDPYAYSRPNPLTNPVYAHSSPPMMSPGYYPQPQMHSYPLPLMPYQTSPPYYYPPMHGHPPPAASPPLSQKDTAAEEQFMRLQELIQKEKEERIARENEREAKAAKEEAEKAAAAALLDAANKATKDAEAAAAKKAKEAAEAHEKALAEAKAATDAAKKAKEKAEKDAAAAAKADDKEPIKFKDALGRKFTFPFALCRTWKDMEKLIKQAFKAIDPYEKHVEAGHFELHGPNDEIILPQVWESTVLPGYDITMHFWPMEEEKKKDAAPAANPAAAAAAKKQKAKQSRSSRLFAAAPAPPPPPPAGGAAAAPAGVEIVVEKPKKKSQSVPPLVRLFGGPQVRHKSVKKR